MIASTVELTIVTTLAAVRVTQPDLIKIADAGNGRIRLTMKLDEQLVVWEGPVETWITQYDAAEKAAMDVAAALFGKKRFASVGE